MNEIRLATTEEIESIRPTSDLDYATQVFAFPKDSGTSDLAVFKWVPELDPVYFSEGSDNRRKLLFIWALENHMRLNGLGAYYFNIDSSNETWQKVVTNSGAQAVSPTPEIRFKKLLVPKVIPNVN